MHGSERREQIIRQIQESKAPVSGTKLASFYNVSRQVIVQDIALIRAAGYEIISTNRGYILNQPKTVCRIFKVQHTDEQLEEELNTIVDLGGCVDNVMIHHRVYGKMEAELVLNSEERLAHLWKIFGAASQVRLRTSHPTIIIIRSVPTAKRRWI